MVGSPAKRTEHKGKERERAIGPPYNEYSKGNLKRKGAALTSAQLQRQEQTDRVRKMITVYVHQVIGNLQFTCCVCASLPHLMLLSGTSYQQVSTDHQSA